MPQRGPVLILGGTAEARRSAAALDARGACRVVAGRAACATPRCRWARSASAGSAAPPAWRRGSRDHDVAAVVDATHPFASTMTRSAAPLRRDRRPAAALRRRAGAAPGADWHWADSCRRPPPLPSLGKRAFLTTGRRASRPSPALDLAFLVRASTRRRPRCRTGGAARPRPVHRRRRARPAARAPHRRPRHQGQRRAADGGEARRGARRLPVVVVPPPRPGVEHRGRRDRGAGRSPGRPRRLGRGVNTASRSPRRTTRVVDEPTITSVRMSTCSGRAPPSVVTVTDSPRRRRRRGHAPPGCRGAVAPAAGPARRPAAAAAPSSAGCRSRSPGRRGPRPSRSATTSHGLSRSDSEITQRSWPSGAPTRAATASTP